MSVVRNDNTIFSGNQIGLLPGVECMVCRRFDDFMGCFVRVTLLHVVVRCCAVRRVVICNCAHKSPPPYLRVIPDQK